MIVLTLTLFVVATIAIWRRGPGAGGIAYLIAALIALSTLVMRTSTGFYQVGTSWRIEAEYCGLTLAFALLVVGLLRD